MQRIQGFSLPGRTVAIAILAACAGLLAGCGSNPAADETPPSAARLANPASMHCGRLGGQLGIERTPEGAEYAVCTFQDNRQCEEWAMFRGQCPAGGIRVTGYVTGASRFCAITGGRYAIVADNAAGERGTCSLPDGRSCDADAYYRGKCVR
jgi:putative hemolysin